MADELKRTLVHLGEKQLEQLDELAGKSNVSRAAHIRLAIDDYLRKQARKAKR
jgi:predicted transcriptional regulator